MSHGSSETAECIDWQSAKNFLTGTSLGSVIASVPEMPSTQIPAKEAARNGAQHGTVFVTDFQVLGRGRRDRGWDAVRGKDLTFSTILRLDFDIEHAPLLSLASALAVYDVLAEKLSGVAIKWPNDVLVGEKKICGIICELVRDDSNAAYAVIGIGVNVNRTMDELGVALSPGGARPTSMLVEGDAEFYLPRLLAEVLGAMKKTVDMLRTASGRAELIDRYTESCGSVGRELRVIADGREYLGVATGISPGGAIEVATAENGIMSFEAADVVHARFKKS